LQEAWRVPLPTAYVSWSSGKDSAFALYEARRSGRARIAGVLTTINEVYGGHGRTEPDGLVFTHVVPC